MISGQQYSENHQLQAPYLAFQDKEIGGKLSPGKLMICEVNCGMLTYTSLF